jgi:hypothetical protein
MQWFQNQLFSHVIQHTKSSEVKELTTTDKSRGMGRCVSIHRPHMVAGDRDVYIIVIQTPPLLPRNADSEVRPKGGNGLNQRYCAVAGAEPTFHAQNGPK